MREASIDTPRDQELRTELFRHLDAGVKADAIFRVRLAHEHVLRPHAKEDVTPPLAREFAGPVLRQRMQKFSATACKRSSMF